MAARRSSARLSAGDQAQDMRTGSSATTTSVNGNGKRKGGGTQSGESAPTPKKRKQAPKKQSAFKPQMMPVINSSDTPPDDNYMDMDEPLLGAPPSERKIARRRESTRGIRERHSPSPTPPPKMILKPTTKKPSSRSGRETVRAAANTSDDPLAGVEETSSMRSGSTVPPVENLRFSKSSRPRPSAPRPLSPPRRTFGPSSSATAGPSSLTMGPPTGFVRKTRQSTGRGYQNLSKESVVPIAESETPVIRKNQELRGGQARRSSMDSRGGRASSSWGKGEITMPHKSVDAKLFYRHIPTAYPDPIKTRMLLVWCANRATDDILRSSSSRSKSKGKSRESDEGPRTDEGDKLIKDIMEDFVLKMNKGIVSTDTLGKVGQDASASGLKPHPRNVINRQVESTTTALIKKHKGESAQWSALVHSTNSKQTEVIRKLEKQRVLLNSAEPDMKSAEGWMRQAADLANGIIAEGEGDLSAMGDFADVEYKVDTLLQTSHVALQYSLQATRFLDGIFSSLTADLRARDRLGLPSDLPIHQGDGPDTTSLLSTARLTSVTSTESQSTQNQNKGKGKGKGDTMSLLRALASAESKNQSDDTVAAAAKVAPMPAMAMAMSTSTAPSSSSSNTTGTGTAMTPRRPAGMTPRRPVPTSAHGQSSMIGGVSGLAPGTTPRRGYKATTPAGVE